MIVGRESDNRKRDIEFNLHLYQNSIDILIGLMIKSINKSGYCRLKIVKIKFKKKLNYLTWLGLAKRNSLITWLCGLWHMTNDLSSRGGLVWDLPDRLRTHLLNGTIIILSFLWGLLGSVDYGAPTTPTLQF